MGGGGQVEEKGGEASCFAQEGVVLVGAGEVLRGKGNCLE